MFFRKTGIDLAPKLKWGVGRGFNGNKVLRYGSYTVLSIAALLAIQSARLIMADQQLPQSAQVLGAFDRASAAPEEHFIEYAVKSGETLFSISQKHTMSWTLLATLNKLEPPFALTTGQILKIPKE